jgi:uncharacterized protein (DUF58 family)
MLTDRGKVLLAVSLVAWLIHRTFGVPEAMMAAMAAITLVVVGIVATRVASAQLVVRRHVQPPRLFHDARGEVELRLTNHGRLPTASIQLDDRAPSHLAEGARFALRPLGPGETIRLRYRLHGRHRGRYELGPARIALRDPFGVAQRVQELGDLDTVIVYPPVWRLPAGLPLAGHLGGGVAGRPRIRPQGDELANVRDYVRGDDLRKVHWRSTAHRGTLMVRQDESAQSPQAVVVLDGRAQAHRGTGPGSSFESAVTVAASVTYHLSARGYGFQLLSQPLAGPPRPEPWELVLDRLAVIQPLSADMDALWKQLSHGVVGEGVLFLVAPVPTPTELRQIVRAGRAFGSRVALLIDVVTFAGRPPVGHATEIAQRANALRAAGWRVALIGAGDRLDDRWRELIAQRSGYFVRSGGA